MKKVAIIGAGAAGLCTAKHMLTSRRGVGLLPVIFEQTNVVGGTWVYEETQNNKDVFSSIYKNLKTNLPKQAMNFPDFPFQDSVPSFMHHTEVRKYLEDYAEHFNVVPHIRFQTKVVSVDPLPKKYENDHDEWCRWLVKYEQVDGQLKTEKFDAVVVCNGHYSDPSYPTIPGLHFYKSKKIHSHLYRDPNDYIGTKKALVLGFGPSGRDIGLELAGVCDTVYFSHKGDRCKSKLPKNAIEITNISHVTEEGAFVTDSGDVITDVHLFVLCTGYLVTFPFLSEKVNLRMKYNRIVENLYRMVFCADHPSLSIVGIPWKVAPFPLMHQQSAYITSILNETKSLPSRDEMLRDIEEDRQRRLAIGEPDHHLHKLGNAQFEYSDMLSTMSGYDKNPKIIENLNCYIAKYEKFYLMDYKNMEFKQISDEEFEVVRSIGE